MSCVIIKHSLALWDVRAHMTAIDYGQTTRLAAYTATLSIIPLIDYRPIRVEWGTIDVKGKYHVRYENRNS